MEKKVNSDIKLFIIIGLIGIFIIAACANCVSARVHILEIYAANDTNNTLIQNIQLNSGWNLISLGVVPVNSSIDYIVRDIKWKLIIIKSFDNGGKTYDPGNPLFSSLKNMDEKHGYWVKMNQSANLTVIGNTNFTKTINLSQNWNLIGYLCNYNRNVTDLFSGVMNSVIIIKGFENGNGLTYDPNNPLFSTLKQQKPRYGYWVKMNQSAILNYNC
jgi:hypothetical protein